MIHVTDTAVEYLKQAMIKEGVDPSKTGVRLGVKGGGCSGFSYVIDFAAAPSVIDEIFEIQGLRFFVDKKSIRYIDEMTLDWVTRGLNKSFIFSNPNAKTECGCGTSFSV